MALITLFASLFLMVYWYYIQSHLAFAATLIEIALKVIKDNIGLWYSAIGMLFTLIVFASVWTLALLGYANCNPDNFFNVQQVVPVHSH